MAWNETYPSQGDPLVDGFDTSRRAVPEKLEIVPGAPPGRLPPVWSLILIGVGAVLSLAWTAGIAWALLLLAGWLLS